MTEHNSIQYSKKVKDLINLFERTKPESIVTKANPISTQSSIAVASIMREQRLDAKISQVNPKPPIPKKPLNLQKQTKELEKQEGAQKFDSYVQTKKIPVTSSSYVNQDYEEAVRINNYNKGIFEEVNDDTQSEVYSKSIYDNVTREDIYAHFERSSSFIYYPYGRIPIEKNDARTPEKNVQEKIKLESSSNLNDISKKLSQPKVVENNNGKNSPKSIDKFINDPNFFYFFNKYISSYKNSIENLTVNSNSHTRDTFFLLLLSDVFCKVKKGDDPKVGKEVLYYYKDFNGTKRDFLYNKSYPGNALIRIMNQDFGQGLFTNLFSYLHHYSHSSDGTSTSIAFNVIQHLENKENPTHKIKTDEIECTQQRLNDFKSVIEKNHMSFENFYRFYNEHKVMLNAELKVENLEKRMKQKGHELLEKIEEKIPSTKMLETKISQFTSHLKGYASHLFNMLLYVVHIV
jgi:hypothetical protein